LWQDLAKDEYDIFISPAVTEELDECGEPKRSQIYQKLREIKFQLLTKTSEVSHLANEYINHGALKKNSFDDCMHIAFAVVYNCDVIVSWNFKHLVNFRTINKVKIVNAINQYREISIITPTMLLKEGD
jgi:predicted nucleic acid-binding protein